MELNHDEFMIGWIEEQEKPVLFTSFKKVEVQSSVVDKRNVSGQLRCRYFIKSVYSYVAFNSIFGFGQYTRRSK